MKVILLILYIVLSLIGMSLATSASMHGNTVFIIPAFTLPFLVMLLYYVLCFLKSYRRIKKLHRNGKHATGQMTEKAGARSGRHCRILFHDSDGAGHVCVSYWTRRSLSRDSEVSVLYEPEHPQNSCVEKMICSLRHCFFMYLHFCLLRFSQPQSLVHGIIANRLSYLIKLAVL